MIKCPNCIFLNPKLQRNKQKDLKRETGWNQLTRFGLHPKTSSSLSDAAYRQLSLVLLGLFLIYLQYKELFVHCAL